MAPEIMPHESSRKPRRIHRPIRQIEKNDDCAGFRGAPRASRLAGAERLAMALHFRGVTAGIGGTQLAGSGPLSWSAFILAPPRRALARALAQVTQDAQPSPLVDHSGLSVTDGPEPASCVPPIPAVTPNGVVRFPRVTVGVGCVWSHSFLPLCEGQDWPRSGRPSGMIVLGRHRGLAKDAWSEPTVRATIEEIAADAIAHFHPDTFGPSHPSDDGVGDGDVSFYVGAASVIWALDYLHRVGATQVAEDFRPVLPKLPERTTAVFQSTPGYAKHGSSATWVRRLSPCVLPPRRTWPISCIGARRPIPSCRSAS
jgi:hypothetical protein